MTFREILEKQGNWLFRWRSYLPLFLLSVLCIALPDSEYLERYIGNLANIIWEIFCVTISLLGLSIRCATVGFVPKGTSGRNTKKQIAETLNTTGMYSIVRHPIYLGNFFITLGLALFVEVWWFTLISVLAFWLYYERIIFMEEEFLRKNYRDLYLEWAKRTPAFIPNIKNWRKPNLSFSFKTILKREYTTFFVIIASFTFLDIVADLFGEGKLEFDVGWLIMFIFSSIIYLTLRTLKKKTKLLDVEGR